MKRIISLLVALMFCVVSFAQSVAVKSFLLQETDLTANLQGTTVLDLNGNKCALIKIVTTAQGFTFDVGSLGIAKTEYKTGEIWLYVPQGVKRLTMNHQVYGQLEYNFPIPVQSARTYKMTLEVENIAQKSNQQLLSIKVSPATAMVLIDNEIVEMQNGVATLSVSKGDHSYNVVAKGYTGQSGSVMVKEGNNAKLVVELDPTDGNVMLAEPLTAQKEKDCTIRTLENGNKEITIKGVTFTMVRVEGGTFTMGATPEQKGAWGFEKPAHNVTLSNYFIGQTEVTQALWTTVMGTNPSYFKGLGKPVECVSWNDCQEFVAKLSELTKQKFRLPTEAEWEYAARGGRKSLGTMYSGGNNIDDVAWYEKNSGKTTHDVATKHPNELGLYDMSGNVWEWCQDWFGNKYYKKSESINPQGPSSGSDRVYRGGSWSNYARNCRVSYRRNINTSSRSSNLGLRLVLSE